MVQTLAKNNAVVVSDNSPEMRGARLKRVRNLANLSRDQMCDDGEIKRNTLIGWECARFGGLTSHGAIKVLTRITREGVHCTLEWLLDGIGPEPSVNPLIQCDLGSEGSDENIIESELAFFKVRNMNAVHIIVKDEGMSPHYHKTDYVAGIKRAGKEIRHIIGRDCIVQLEDGRTLLRNVREGSHPDTYTLICNNPLITSKNWVISDVKLIYAAPVIWHRRIDV